MATCVISGTILNLDGTPNSDVAVVARVESSLDDYGGQVNVAASAGVTSMLIEVFTDDAGYFELTILQGARILLEIESMALRKMVDVPETSTANLLDLI